MLLEESIWRNKFEDADSLLNCKRFRNDMLQFGKFLKTTAFSFDEFVLFLVSDFVDFLNDTRQPKDVKYAAMLRNIRHRFELKGEW